MSDDYVESAAERAVAAARGMQNANQPMTTKQELAVVRQALLEQRLRADSNAQAWVMMMVFALITNLGWAIWTWWPR